VAAPGDSSTGRWPQPWPGCWLGLQLPLLTFMVASQNSFPAGLHHSSGVTLALSNCPWISTLLLSFLPAISSNHIDLPQWTRLSPRSNYYFTSFFGKTLHVFWVVSPVIYFL
jgi:hypothetical protein